VVLLHMVAQVDRNLPVYFLETGKHFPETLDYVETLKQQLGLANVIALRPDAKDLLRFDPPATCGRPIPIRAATSARPSRSIWRRSGFGGWVTGRKRYQTAERGVLPHFELTSDDRVKVNPLAYFSDADIAAYKLKYGLPEHPLYAKGYKSIGCAPCTSVVAEGEDPRAGRWRGLNKKECGIHFDFNGAIAKPMAARRLKPVQGRRLHRRSVPPLGRGR
jgi:phosphoadenosine phosphosulfate reductase